MLGQGIVQGKIAEHEQLLKFVVAAFWAGIITFALVIFIV